MPQEALIIISCSGQIKSAAFAGTSTPPAVWTVQRNRPDAQHQFYRHASGPPLWQVCRQSTTSSSDRLMIFLLHSSFAATSVVILPSQFSHRQLCIISGIFASSACYNMWRSKRFQPDGDSVARELKQYYTTSTLHMLSQLGYGLSRYSMCLIDYVDELAPTCSASPAG